MPENVPHLFTASKEGYHPWMPQDPHTVIPFYSLRLRHVVAAKGRIVVWCRACRRTGYLDPVDVIALRGPELGVRDLDKLLRCDGCGRKGFADVRMDWF